VSGRTDTTFPLRVRFMYRAKKTQKLKSKFARRSSENLRSLLPFRYFNPDGEGNKYKLLIIFGDPFLWIISTSGPTYFRQP